MKPQHHVQHQGFNRDVRWRCSSGLRLQLQVSKCMQLRQSCSAAEIDVDSKLVAETEAAEDAVADAHDDAS